MVERTVSPLSGMPKGISGIGGYKYAPSKLKWLDDKLTTAISCAFGGLVAVRTQTPQAMDGNLETGEWALYAFMFVCIVCIAVRLKALNSRILGGYLMHLKVDANVAGAAPQYLNFYFGDACPDDWVQVDQEREREKARDDGMLG